MSRYSAGRARPTRESAPTLTMNGDFNRLVNAEVAFNTIDGLHQELMRDDNYNDWNGRVVYRKKLVCKSCVNEAWPCPTRRALDKAARGEDTK